MKKLSETKKGVKAKIIKIEKDEIYIKLIEMGFIPNIEITVENIAILGDPIIVSLMGNTICLRQNEASKIYVEIL